MEFAVSRGDIAAQSAGALVNAAGTSLEVGCGVAGFDLAEEVRDSEPAVLEDVRPIAYSDEEYDALRVAAGTAEQSEGTAATESDR